MVRSSLTHKDLMQNLDIRVKIPISTRKRKIVSTTPDFKRKLARLGAGVEMSTSDVDLIESVAGSDRQNHKENMGTRESAGKNGEVSKTGEVNEIEIESGTDGSSGTESGSGPAVIEAANLDETPEKSDSVTGKKLGENEENISNATARLILKKQDEASKERNTISGFFEKKIQELKTDVKEVEKKTEMVSAMQEDIKNVKEGMEERKKHGGRNEEALHQSSGG